MNNKEYSERFKKITEFRKKYGRCGRKFYRNRQYALRRFNLLFDYAYRLDFEKIESCHTYVVSWWF